MNIQRFIAPTAREALARARAAFGDETLILSNRQLPEGVEVMAATEAALALIDAPQQPANASQQPVIAPKEAAPAPAPRPPAPAVLLRVADTAVEADTEQLAMSTLSFQDYVRERMLRRRHEALGPQAAEEGLPAMPEPTPVPVPAQMPVPARVAVEPMHTPVTSTVHAPVDADQNAVAAEAREDNATPASRPSAAPAFEARATTDSSAASAHVLAELQAMKALMDERFTTLAWLGHAQQNPIQQNLMLKLVRAGYSPGLARAVLEGMPAELDPPDAVRWLLEMLESRLGCRAAQPTLAEEGGVFALIGATGVGKTTSAAKLATFGAQMYGAAGVGLVTLDTQRAGAHEQLRAHGRTLGVVAHAAHDRAALLDLLGLLAGKKMVVIDTAGVAPHDPRRRDVLDLLDVPGIKRVLVLNAGAHGDTLEDMAIAFKLGGTREAIVSKVDEAAKLGPVIDVLIRHEFAVRGISNGQRVPDDWQAGDARGLVRASMQAAQRSAFDPKTADLPCYFSPAGAGA